MLPDTSGSIVHAVGLTTINHLFTVPLCCILQDVGDKQWAVLHQTSHLGHRDVTNLRFKGVKTLSFICRLCNQVLRSRKTGGAKVCEHLRKSTDDVRV